MDRSKTSPADLQSRPTEPEQEAVRHISGEREGLYFLEAVPLTDHSQKQGVALRSGDIGP